MHESVATAKYKGYERKLDNYDFKRAITDFGGLPNKRAARLRAIPKLINRMPSVVILSHGTEGSGARAELSMFGLEIGKDTNGSSPGWFAFLDIFKARDSTIERVDLPVIVTHHLVKRMMQRLKIEDPRKALTGLHSALSIALALKEPRDREVLLAARGGAVIAVRHDVFPEVWVFVTFVDDAKLSSTQWQSIEFWAGKAAEAIKAQKEGLVG